MVEDLVFTFVGGLDTERANQIQRSLRRVRDQLQMEMRKGLEFIGVNGRLYRYGFVSPDDDRTRELAKIMFSDDLGDFQKVFPGVETWNDVTSLKLKTHLEKTRTELSERLPVPFNSVDDQSLRWLKGIYLTLPNLNKHWDTKFDSWGDVSVSEAVHPMIVELTEENTEDLKEMLKNLTAHALTFVPREPDFENVKEAMSKNEGKNHGKVELLFAHIAAVQNRDPEDVYLTLLRYLARSVKEDSFSPLPPGFKKSPTQTRDVGDFLSKYYTTDDHMVRDWGTKDPVKHIPVTTVPSFPEFKSLVQSL